MAMTERTQTPSPSRAPRRGVREKQKERRFTRIKLVARELFLKEGYEATTLRVVARKARVGTGTILRYVENKRDLLFLLFNDDHAAVSEKAYVELADSKNFLDQSIDGFRHYYRYFASYPEYARAILREGTFYDPLQLPPSVIRSTGRIKRTIEIARARGEIAINESDDTLAALVFEEGKTDGSAQL